MSKASLSTVTWNEVREEVRKVHPGLAQEIDNISPSDKYKLFKVRYPFGELILNSGILQIPNAEGKLCSIDDVSIDPTIKTALAYTPTMPIGIVLKNTIEMLWLKGNNTAPWLLMPPGRIFALWSLLQKSGTTTHTAKMWNIAAGCRSLIILPKISDATGFKRLRKEFNLTTGMPKNLRDQWDLLKELTSSPQFNSSWEVELLFFSKDWYEKILDHSWKELEYYLLKFVWDDTSYMRDEVVFNFVFSRALIDKNLKPNPYLTDTVKHIYAIARKCFAGFKVASDDSSAPIKRLEQIFADIYQLKFAPTFLHPGYFDLKNTYPIYYSLEIPTLFDFSPKSRKAANKMSDIREVKHIQTVIGKYIRENKASFAKTPIYDVATKVEYNYYHSDPDVFHEVENSSEVVKYDKNMQQNLKTYDKPICTSSPFLRGCVRIGTIQSG